MRVARALLISLPLITVVVVAVALIVVAAPRPYVGARVYGGPVQGADQVALRIEAVLRLGHAEEPFRNRRIELIARRGDWSTSWTGRVDAQGNATPRLTLAGPRDQPLAVQIQEVDPPRRILANGKLELSSADWARRGRGRMQLVKGRAKGVLQIAVSAGRGVFAVPFVDPLHVEVRAAGRPLEDVLVEFEPNGLSLSKTQAKSDSKGQVRLKLRPLEHATSLKVIARAPDGRTGTWFGNIPVAPGALHALRQGSRLRLASPVQRERAYYAVIRRDARLAGGSVALTEDGRGGSVGELTLPALPKGELWCVVSSEVDLAAPSTVGWPCGDAPPPQPTFAVADQLLLNGLIYSFRDESARRDKARYVATGFGAAAALLTALLLWLTVRRARAQLNRHLRAAGSDGETIQRVVEGRAWGIWLVIAVFSVLLGFAVVSLTALARLGG